MSQPTPIQSIKRALDLLDYLTIECVQGEGALLQDLAKHIDVAAPTAHNIVRTMVSCGYIDRDNDHRYRLGPRCLDLARSSQLSGKVLPGAAEVVDKLSDEIGDSVVMTTLLHGKRYPLLRNEGNGLIRVSTTVEDTSNFFAMVTGQILAAYATPAELDAILTVHGYPGKHWHDITEMPQLQHALQEVRQTGYAESLTGNKEIYALAMPILDHEKQIIGALGCYLPAFRASQDHIADVRSALAAAAFKISSLS